MLNDIQDIINTIQLPDDSNITLGMYDEDIYYIRMYIGECVQEKLVYKQEIIQSKLPLITLIHNIIFYLGQNISAQRFVYNTKIKPNLRLIKG